MPGGDYGLRVHSGGQDLGEWLPLGPLEGCIEKAADVDVGSVPDPVLVSEVPVGDDTGAVELAERGGAAGVDEREHLLGRSDGSRGRHQVQESYCLGEPHLRLGEPVGISQPGGDFGPPGRLPSRGDIECSAGNKVVIDHFET